MSINEIDDELIYTTVYIQIFNFYTLLPSIYAELGNNVYKIKYLISNN